MKIVIDIGKGHYDTICDGFLNECLISTTEVIKNGTPLEKVLEDIKAEIQALTKTYPFINHKDDYIIEREVMEIIDKHIAERSRNDTD